VITDRFLGNVAEYVNTNITKVVINQTHEITDFAVKAVQGNVLMIEYMVPAASVEVINQIQLRDGTGALVSENQVYVPVPSDTIIRQTITVSEQTGVMGK